VIDVATNTVSTTITLSHFADEVGITPDGTKAYVAYTRSSVATPVAIIDTSTDTISATITVGTGVVGITFIPGALAYMSALTSATIDTGAVFVVDTATDTITTSIPTGLSPLGIAATPDGSQVYVCTQSGYVSVIDTSTNTITATISVAQGYGASATPDGTAIYISDEDKMLVIDTATNTISATITVGSQLTAFENFIQYTPFGPPQFVYISDWW
jgi:YVTN family beta-propeller protein